jgi:homoserine O-acetyltransferase
MLLDRLGIPTLLSMLGGSMGGMQVLQWAATYPDRVFSAVPIAAGARHSSQNIGFHEVGRQAIMADPDWRGGRYLVEGTNPRKGLAVAMVAHITYMSDKSLHEKFGRICKTATGRSSLLTRIDRSYLRTIVRVVERRRKLLSLHDAGDGLFRPGGRLWRAAGECLHGSKTRLRGVVQQRLAVPTEENTVVAPTRGASVSFVEIETLGGHDAFPLDEPELNATIRGFLGAEKRAGSADGTVGKAGTGRVARRTASTSSRSRSSSRRARRCWMSAAATGLS